MNFSRELLHRFGYTVAALAICGLLALPQAVEGRQLVRRAVSFPSRAAIRFYQFFISSQDLPTCHFSPSCSSFSLEAFAATDPLQATLMTFDRLQRCHYWIPGEYPFQERRFVDPVQRHTLWGNGALTAPALAPAEEVTAFCPAPLPPATLLRAGDAMIAAGDVDSGLEEYLALQHDEAPAAVRLAAGRRAVWILLDREAYAEAALVAEPFAAGPENADLALLALLARALDPAAALPSNPDIPLGRYIVAWGELLRGQTTPARETLASLAGTTDAEVALASRELLAALAPLDGLRQRRGWIAGGLSLAVPGLGRVYTGRYGDAAFSFILTSGASGLARRAIAGRGRIEAALFSGTAAGLYLGSAYGSIISARTENERQRAAVIQRALGDVGQQGYHPHTLLRQRLEHRLEPRLPVAAGSDPLAVRLAQDVADQSFGRHSWDAAARWYRIHQYLAPREALTDSLLFRYAAALELTAKAQDQAIQATYETLFDAYPTSPLVEPARIALAHAWLRRGHPALARLELEDQRASGATAALIAEADYLMTWTFLHDYRWRQASDWLEAHPGDGSSPFDESAAAIRRRLAAPRPRKSPRLARWLSAFVPGLGQLYAGRPLDAAGALAINSVTGYALSRSIRSRNWLDTGLVTVLLINRFYTGNLYHAARLAREYNQRRDHALLTELSVAAGEEMPWGACQSCQ